MSNEITNYVYHLYGDEEIFLAEAFYSLGTLLKQIDPKNSRIIFFTDQPEKIRSLPVVCVPIAEHLDEMKGPFGFGYRIKLCCIQKCAESFPGNIIYLDCDTIVKRPVQKLAAMLKKGQALMHHQERLVGRFPRFETFQTQLPDGLKYGYSPESCMFNAGVIGIHRSDATILKTALALCDSLMKEGIRYHICEQFAVSEALRISGVKILEAHKVVAHYYRTSAKRYVHDQIPRFAARLKKEKKELWNFDRPMPYSYPRVQLHKLMRKFF